MARICNVCKKNKATVPDRTYAGLGRLVMEVCESCHAERLKGDLRHILKCDEDRKNRYKWKVE